MADNFLPDIRINNQTGHALNVHGAADGKALKLTVTDGLRRPRERAFIRATIAIREAMDELRDDDEDVHERRDDLRAVAEWLESL